MMEIIGSNVVLDNSSLAAGRSSFGCVPSFGINATEQPVFSSVLSHEFTTNVLPNNTNYSIGEDLALEFSHESAVNVPSADLDIKIPDIHDLVRYSDQKQYSHLDQRHDSLSYFSLQRTDLNFNAPPQITTDVQRTLQTRLNIEKNMGQFRENFSPSSQGLEEGVLRSHGSEISFKVAVPIPEEGRQYREHSQAYLDLKDNNSDKSFTGQMALSSSSVAASSVISDHLTEGNQQSTLGVPSVPVISTGQVGRGANLPVSENEPISRTVSFSPEKTVPRIGQAILQVIQRGDSSIELRLDPPELGRLTLSLIVDGESLNLQATTSSSAIRDLFVSHGERLRQTLADQGLELEGLSVNVQTEQRQDQTPSQNMSLMDLPLETLTLADSEKESGHYVPGSLLFQIQGGSLLDYFV